MYNSQIHSNKINEQMSRVKNLGLDLIKSASICSFTFEGGMSNGVTPKCYRCVWLRFDKGWLDTNGNISPNATVYCDAQFFERHYKWYDKQTNLSIRSPRRKRIARLRHGCRLFNRGVESVPVLSL